MRTFLTKIFVAILLCGSVFLAKAEEQLVRREWTVNGVKREALLYIPASAKTNAVPLVFAFHGHGGSMRHAARMFHIETLWPEAMVVYMQGLNTPGKLTDPEGKKPGWQSAVGMEKDRDLKFFDAVLASMKKDYKVDAKRIYSTGHSNGGGFTYLLWEARGKEFAAFAPSAAVGRSLVESNPAFARDIVRRGIVTTNEVTTLKASSADQKFLPKPVLHVAGENDTLVKYEWQKMMMAALRKANQCGEGKPWHNEKGCTIYESKVGAPVVTFIHPGTHNYPEKAPALIVEFFKEHAQP